MDNHVPRLTDMKRLLIVEDHLVSREVIKACVSSFNLSLYECAEAGSLSEALSLLATQRVDLIFLDLHLPDSTGLETVDRIIPHAQGAAIIVITGAADEEIGEEAIRKGAQDYLVKGKYDAYAMKKAMRYALERQCIATELCAEKERCKNVLMNMPVALLRIDAHEEPCVRECNPAAEAVFGYTSSEFIGMPLRKLYSDDKTYSLFMSNSVVCTGMHGAVYRMRSKSGNTIYTEQAVSTISDQQGNSECRVVFARDISQRIEVEHALKKSYDEIYAQKKSLEHKTIALKEVLEQGGIEKEKLKQNILLNIESLVLPQLIKMRVDVPSSERYIETIIKTLHDITSPFGRLVAPETSKLAPREKEIATLIHQGLTSKEIAKTLSISVQTVEKHRTNIRKKLNLTDQSVNLSSYFQTI